MSNRNELENSLLELEKRKGKSYFNWVQDYWTTRGNRLDLGIGNGTKRQYVTQIYKDQHPNIVYKKSAQVGITERMLTEALWLPDQYRENALYLFPTYGTVSDLVQERVDGPINDNPYLLGVAGRSKQILGKKADNTGLKRMSEGFIYFRGSNKPTQITSVPADIIVLDEVDRMIVENIPYAEKRLLNSTRKWKRAGSTPTIPDFGIDAMYADTDQNEWYLKCNSCNEQQHLTFEDNVDLDKAIIVCSKCRKQMIPWECKGEWIPKYPGRDTRGYFIHQLYAPNVDLKNLIKLSKSSNEFELTQFYNQDLGIAYEAKGSRISEMMLNACKRGYNAPEVKQGVFMGIDVGKVLHVIVRDEEKILDIREVKNFMGPENSAEAMIRQYDPRSVVIDALPETRKAQELAHKFKGRVYLCYYTGLAEVKEGEWFKVTEEKVNTDRTISLDYSFSNIKSQTLFLPNNLDNYPDFKAQMKALVRSLRVDAKGNQKAEYVKVGADHYAHANNYANIAKEIMTRVIIPEVFIL